LKNKHQTESDSFQESIK